MLQCTPILYTILLCLSFFTTASFAQEFSTVVPKNAIQYPTTDSQKDSVAITVSDRKITQEAQEIVVAKQNLELLQEKIQRLQQEHDDALLLLEKSTTKIKAAQVSKISQQNRTPIAQGIQSEAESDLLKELQKIAEEDGAAHVQTNLKIATPEISEALLNTAIVHPEKTVSETKKRIVIQEMTQEEAERDLFEELQKVAEEEGTAHVQTNLTIVTPEISEAVLDTTIVHQEKTVSETKKRIVIQEVSQEEAERDLFEELQKTAEEEGIAHVQTNLKIATPEISETIVETIATPSTVTSLVNEVATTYTTSLEEYKNNPFENTQLLEERIDTSNVLQKKIHRVLLTSVSGADADNALKLKKQGVNVENNPKISIANITEITARFNGNTAAIKAHISHVDNSFNKTTITTSLKSCSPIVIPETRGGSLSSIKLDGCDRDYLLFTAKINDTDFDKYFLYVLRDNTWKPVMKSFAIHKSNKAQATQIIKSNPENPNEILRNYSVFNIDEESATGYTWQLLEESVPKIAW